MGIKKTLKVCRMGRRRGCFVLFCSVFFPKSNPEAASLLGQAPVCLSGRREDTGLVLFVEEEQEDE